MEKDEHFYTVATINRVPWPGTSLRLPTSEAGANSTISGQLETIKVAKVFLRSSGADLIISAHACTHMGRWEG